MSKSKFHVVAGLPRSGSTLLCNILNQRDDTYASSTSSLPAACVGLAQLFSSTAEETSRLANIQNTEEHHKYILKNLMHSWHDTEMPVVFDKGRGWAKHNLLLQSASPESAMIVLVRDPRDVFASTERRNRETGIYNSGTHLDETASKMLSPEGLIGGPISFVEDLLARQMPNVLFVPYNQLASAPQHAMSVIETHCSLTPFDYDFLNVEASATDLDALYRGKFPHTGAGEVKPSASDWRQVLPEELGTKIINRWPLYCSTFGFR